MSTLSTTGSLNSYVASTYGSGTYDGSAYNGSTSTSSTGSGGSSSSGGVLTNTGFDIALIVTIACVIALLAVIVRVWRRPKHSVTSD